MLSCVDYSDFVKVDCYKPFTTKPSAVALSPGLPLGVYHGEERKRGRKAAMIRVQDCTL
jgi:hypothetical protein